MLIVGSILSTDGTDQPMRIFVILVHEACIGVLDHVFAARSPANRASTGLITEVKVLDRGNGFTAERAGVPMAVRIVLPVIPVKRVEDKFAAGEGSAAVNTYPQGGAILCVLLVVFRCAAV